MNLSLQFLLRLRVCCFLHLDIMIVKKNQENGKVKHIVCSTNIETQVENKKEGK